MELPQAASEPGPQPDLSNVNNNDSAAEKITPFEKEQERAAYRYAKTIIDKQSAGVKGKADANADLKGKHRLPYPSIETFSPLSPPKPVDFALQGSDIVIMSFKETHPQLNLQFKCPNQCGGLLTHNGWSQNARCCHALDRAHYIVSRKYSCKRCGRKLFIFLLN